MEEPAAWLSSVPRCCPRPSPLTPLPPTPFPALLQSNKAGDPARHTKQVWNIVCYILHTLLAPCPFRGAWEEAPQGQTSTSIRFIRASIRSQPQLTNGELQRHPCHSMKLESLLDARSSWSLSCRPSPTGQGKGPWTRQHGSSCRTTSSGLGSSKRYGNPRSAQAAPTPFGRTRIHHELPWPRPVRNIQGLAAPPLTCRPCYCNQPTQSDPERSYY